MQDEEYGDPVGECIHYVGESGQVEDLLRDGIPQLLEAGAGPELADGTQTPHAETEGAGDGGDGLLCILLEADLEYVDGLDDG